MATHEPKTPVNWPEGHVSVILTLDNALIDECVIVKIHRQEHYLHATTARELEKMLHEKLEEYNRVIDENNRTNKTSIPYV